MNKEISKWLRSVGFEEDRSYLHVWQYRTNPFQLPNDRETQFCFELSTQDDVTYDLIVSLEASGTKPENYSCGSLWLFTEKGNDAKELFKKCILDVCEVFPTARTTLEKAFSEVFP